MQVKIVSQEHINTNLKTFQISGFPTKFFYLLGHLFTENAPTYMFHRVRPNTPLAQTQVTAEKISLIFLQNTKCFIALFNGRNA